jgi:hypothetical protein
MSKPIPHLGYHYYPDEDHFTENDLLLWLPRLESLGAQWLTIRGSQLKAIPEFFIAALIEAGIEPIVHIPIQVEMFSPTDFLPIFTSYARWGVRYVVLFDRPNMRRFWNEASWNRKSLAERFLDLILPFLEAQRSVGLTPILPPLEPGGDYWDTAFLESLLSSFARRGNKKLLEELTLTIYSWTNNRPIDWGLGGPERWIETQPYHTPEGSQDQRGFRIFDWYSQISTNIIGRDLPMLALAGGATFSSPSNELTPEVHTQKNLSIVRALENNDVPMSLKGFCFYLLAAKEPHPHYADSWFLSENETRPIVERLQRLLSSSAKGIRKSLAHYVLLPDQVEPAEVLTWHELSNLLKEKKPTLGFSPLEARLAQEVTIVGSEELIPPAIENDLRKTGCTVHRIHGNKQPELSDSQKYLDYFLSNILGEKHA